MAITNVWVDQLREAGKSPDAVPELVKALEQQGLEVKVCYKKPETLEWLAKGRAVEQNPLFHRWNTSVVALAGLFCSLGAIAFGWFFLA